ncbi:vitamin K epoxide reductase family protein [Candidatus Endomicrobiellum devescovinae]|jgi:hypothetical protein|uniref:vitamin K epoxide reductase family protein n=1 Tax=Candidatus Endomicrobiellum devescovinae TaxID=3242322 RepID=UPI00282E6E58|nr:hypothetical protein [Endomicrobium sp.]
MNFSTKYNSLTKIVTVFLNQLNVKVTCAEVDNSLQLHPNFPSILSISDSLKKWNIDNAILRVVPEKLHDVPTPCISYLEKEGGNFIVLKAVDKNYVTYIDSHRKQVKLSIDNFLKEWLGVILLAEVQETSGEANYKRKKQKENIKKGLIIGVFFLPFLLCFFSVWNTIETFSSIQVVWKFSLFIFLKAIGVIISSLLLWHEVDKTNPLLQQVCTAGKKVNCDAILKSKASKLFKWLSWSEVGFFYFAGGFLVLLFANSQVTSILTLLTCLNIIALPYVVFSILYQWRVTKQWCLLCVMVQLLLIAEFTVSLIFGSFSRLHIIYSDVYLFITCYTLPVVIWFIINPQLLAAQKGISDFKQLQRIKYDSEVFAALLGKQKKITEETSKLGIHIGNPMAKNKLLSVCSPHTPCSLTHQIIDQILELNDTLKLQVIFATSNQEDDPNSLPAKHLLALAEQGDEDKTKYALKYWFGNKFKDYSFFSEKFPLKVNLDLQKDKIKAMQKWCKNMHITCSPTLFINGYQLPDIYNIVDLKYFLNIGLNNTA